MASKLYALSLTLLAATAGFADCCPEPQPCPPPPCEPCCIPKPKKCIDMEAYLHPWYDMQCNIGMFVDVEFLYWYGREYNVFATKYQTVALTTDPAAVTSSDLILRAVKEIDINAKWDPGFRIGLGWEDDCDGWDYGIYWTWYQNHSKKSVSVDSFIDFAAAEGGYSLFSNFENTDPFNVDLNGDVPDIAFEQISGKYHLLFNRIDWELGRKYWVSKCFTMRPYVALRGEWFNSSIKVHSVNTDFIQTDIFSDNFGDNLSYNLIDKTQNKVWGAGFLTGFQPAWYFTREFSLFGNVDAALLWGRNKSTEIHNYVTTDVTAGTTLVDFQVHDRMRFSGMTIDADLAIGLRWEDSWCDDQYRIALDAGWEHHFIYSLNTIQMGGLVLRARFDF